MINKLKEAIVKFNEIRYPESEAKIISIKDDVVYVEFSGTKASFACCFDENFVDLKYYFLDYSNINFEITKVQRISNDRFIVEYRRK